MSFLTPLYCTCVNLPIIWLRNSVVLLDSKVVVSLEYHCECRTWSHSYITIFLFKNQWGSSCLCVWMCFFFCALLYPCVLKWSVLHYAGIIILPFVAKYCFVNNKNVSIYELLVSCCKTYICFIISSAILTLLVLSSDWIAIAMVPCLLWCHWLMVAISYDGNQRISEWDCIRTTVESDLCGIYLKLL